MSVSSVNVSQSLMTFKKKIEDAVILVPEMTAEEKLKAVQFWNVVSEKLQEIVNNSAADINALAMQMQHEKGKEIHTNHAHNEHNHQMSSNKELYLPLMGSQNYNHNHILTDNSHNHYPNSQLIDDNSHSHEEIEQHLAVITAFQPDSGHGHDADDRRLLIAFDRDNDRITNQYNSISKSDINESPKSMVPVSGATTSVIQEVEHHKVNNNYNGRRNVIQSTQSAMQVFEEVKVHHTVSSDSSESGDGSISYGSIFNGTQNKLCNEFNESSEFVDSIDGVDDSSGFDIPNDSDDSDEIIAELIKNEELDLSLEENVSSKKKKKINNINEKQKNRKKNKGKCNKSNDESSQSSVKDNKCEICDKLFPSHSALMSHHWVHTKPYTCSECDARFSTKGNLLVHRRRHTGEKPFRCDQCPACFSTKGNLKRHIKAHSGERPWKCDQCESRFTEKKSLKVHMRRHTGEKPYKCSICSKSFSQTGVLQTHMALHLDERKHLCELCGKAFRQRSQLRLHVLRHEGVKRWDCSDCDAKFLTKGDLERHHRVHTGERPFVCDLCRKTFTRQQSLNEHSNRHYGLKPYSCTVCSKTFAEMSACYKHIKVHKKQQETSHSRINNPKSNNKSKIVSDSITINTKHTHVNVIQTTAAVTNKKAKPEESQYINDVKHYFNSDINSNSNLTNDIVTDGDTNSFVNFASIN